jgi:hypothetical protein
VVKDANRTERLLAGRIDLLPDSRLQHRECGTIRGPGGNWVPIFCANCGAPGGVVPEENMTFAFYLCNACYEQYGAIAGTMAVPDEVFFAQIAARRAETAAKLKEG